MASISTSNALVDQKERLSFAKIAAASSPASPSNGHALAPAAPATAKHKKLVQLAGDPSAPESPLAYMPGAADDNTTTLSSSSDSNKPPSVASGTTFALDEKDSLRPDDSASVKAVEDEELSGSRIGSDDGVRAFRDQLREISSMEPSRRGVPQQQFSNAPKGVLYVPPQGPGIGSVPNASRSSPGEGPDAESPPDHKLLEALENPRDRVWVLKLEQDVIDFVKDAKEASLTLPQCHAFYRLLAHKMADYYMLGHLVDDSTSAVRLYKTPNCRIPPPLTGITAPSTAASTPPPPAPKMTILQRGTGPAIANGSNMFSNSENESEDDKKNKAPVTREQREAQYEAARLRIMGSAKPGDSSDATKDQQESRSSSVAGKKHKKKPRADSDDGFEARSAYSNFYTTSFGSEGMPTSQYGYTEYTDPATVQYATSAYPHQGQAGGQPHLMQGQSGNPWSQQVFQAVDPTQAWAQGQSGAYELANDFQRMSFQSQASAPIPSSNFAQNYAQQYYGSQPGWTQQAQAQSQPQQQLQHHQPQQQQYHMQSQASPSSFAYGPHYTPSNAQMHDPHQPYPFGQLPSQTFPGRPSSHAEHPLPGSYKSKHFNPQSQSFIPSQSNGRPFTPQGPVPLLNGFANYSGASQQMQRQTSSSHSQQSSTFGSPHHHNPNGVQNRAPTQHMTHPLPQGPVYPRHPSPSVPLPPKPATAGGSSAQQQQQQGMGSSLAKWGAPSSLPAKPPPSNEPFDAARLTQLQRQPFSTAAAAARQYPGYTTGMVRRNE